MNQGVSNPKYQPKNSSRISDRRSASGKSSYSYLNSIKNNKDTESVNFKYKNQRDSNLTVEKKIGNKKWQDDSLLDWDPKDYRFFIGNLSLELNNETELINNYFPQFKNDITNLKIIKKKGYGFVSFKDENKYLQFYKEVNGKYLGNTPVVLKKSTTVINPVKKNKNKKNKK